jgi:hypothetical protein
MSKQKNEEDSHYVNNAEFYRQMKEHITAVNKAKRNKTPLPKVSDYIGECIVSIANKLVNKPNFTNYPFREEMVSDGVENCLLYLNNFNPRKSKNPFAYFTQIIYFAFIRRIEKEKKHLYTKYRMIEDALSYELSDSEHSAISKYGSDYADQNMHEFVQNFEKKTEEKKQIMQKKKKLADKKYKPKKKKKKNFENLDA